MTYDKASVKTAIKRKSLSLPAKWLNDKGLIKGAALDYGCGLGADAFLIGMDNYDPNYFPRRPIKKYDTITCTYVLNVLHPDDVPYVVDDIAKYLAPDGTAYIAVRRDIKKEGRTSIGTQQWNVRLPLPILVEKKSRFCIYKLINTTETK